MSTDVVGQGLVRSSLTTVFSDSFLEVNPFDIVSAIKSDGYFCFEKAFTEEFIENIESDVKRNRFRPNKNGISGAYTESQYFLTNMLACSKSFFDYCTDQKVLDVCQSFMGNFFRLKTLRYYETYGSMRMMWHTDSKNSLGFDPITGLIFIAYISDVYDGEFQYIQGSHEYSMNAKKNDFDEFFVKENLQDKIKSFKMPKGSVIIYNTHGIHRAKPAENSNFVRKSLFFQVDSNDRSEPILVNTSYFNKFDEIIKMYLGFGRDGSNISFPQTDESTIPDFELSNLIVNSKRMPVYGG